MKVFVGFLTLLFGCVATENRISTVNCAACQYVAHPTTSWQCDVRCNAEPNGVPVYGSVDAFSASVGTDNGATISYSDWQMVMFDVVHVNIKGGYNSKTGIFNVTIPGVYSASLNSFNVATITPARLTMVMSRADVEDVICSAHTEHTPYNGDSCQRLIEMVPGDLLYVRSKSNSEVFGDEHVFSIFQAYLLYQAELLANP